MLASFTDNLRAALSLLLQMDRAQQLRSMLLVLVFVFLANMASNALYDALNLAWWVTPTLLVLIVLLVVAWLGWKRSRPPVLTPPRMKAEPAPHAGILWCLSVFNAPAHKQAAGVSRETWRRPQLQAALAAQPVNWPEVIERCTHSNLQPAFEAIGHHRRGGGDVHVWLITTCDIKDAQGNIVQEGSHLLAELFEQVLHMGLQWRDVQVHYENPRLQVLPYDLTAAYAAAEYVFLEAAAQCGLAPEHVIADLTGGRVPTTCGIVLACAPRGWALQYTTTDCDPALPGAADTPLPLAIEVDTETIWWSALDALRQRRGSSEE